MSPCLYVNTRGESWRKHSYSAGSDYDQSPYKYWLRRIIGWKEKDNKASFRFGRAVEKAIEYYHDSNGHGIVEKFQELWLSSQQAELVYTKVEKDWASLNRAGTDMMRLYILRQPFLPIPLGGSSVFQREYGKEVFPGDPNYGEIVDAGKLDIVCYVDPAHPMLTKVHWRPEYGLLRPLIVDMKTSGKDFPENPGIAAFDKQLRRYSWQSGIRDVALLWFVKKGHTVKKGNSVTLLADVGNFKAGDEAVVAQMTPDKEKPSAYLVKNDYMVEEMEKAQGKRENGDLDTTKAAVERKMQWLTEYAPIISLNDITKQRLQFNTGFVTQESANDAGLIAGRQIVEIVNSWKNKQWPNTFGIRFPQDDRRDPYFRAFVLNDEAFKSEHFNQTEPNLDDLFEEDSEPEEQE
ncbi:MAG: hypothetical protein OK457_00180 [Thaumarchaeota archaeon]|nr:hypothetical protein [Nitrososphaerota archaeon]